MLAITEAEVEALLDPAALIAAIEDAFRNRFPSMTLPVRTQIHTRDGILLIMPCYESSSDSFGVKMAIVHNDAERADRVQASYSLLDPRTGAPLFQTPARWLTALRTAATSAVATQHLARPAVRSLGVFGTGQLARAHFHVMPLVRKFEQYLVCGIDPARTRDFAQKMSAEVGLSIEPVYPRTCAAESDVICTCTTSPTPLFDGNLLRRGAHLNLVGGFQPYTRESDDATVRNARIVVDTFESALAEAGDLIIPLASGVITRTQILADLHQMLTRKTFIRRDNEEVTLFKSVGCALEDMVAAELLQKALI